MNMFFSIILLVTIIPWCQATLSYKKLADKTQEYINNVLLNSDKKIILDWNFRTLFDPLVVVTINEHCVAATKDAFFRQIVLAKEKYREDSYLKISCSIHEQQQLVLVSYIVLRAGSQHSILQKITFNEHHSIGTIDIIDKDITHEEDGAFLLNQECNITTNDFAGIVKRYMDYIIAFGKDDKALLDRDYLTLFTPCVIKTINCDDVASGQESLYQQLEITKNDFVSWLIQIEGDFMVDEVAEMVTVTYVIRVPKKAEISSSIVETGTQGFDSYYVVKALSFEGELISRIDEVFYSLHSI